MGLTLVTGRANSGKTGVIYDVLRASAAAGERPALLLPTRPDVVRATTELSRDDPVGVQVEQFDVWAAELWSLWGDGRRPVTSEQRTHLIAEAISGVRLRRAATSARTPGFVRVLTYVAQQVAAWPRAALGDAHVRSGLDAELVTILTKYRDLLDAGGLIEPGEAALLLSDRPPVPPGPVLLHRFSDLGHAQEALVVSLSDVADVWLTLTWEEGFPATEAAGRLAERLLPVAARRHCPAPRAVGELPRLEEWLYRAPEPGPAGAAVSFCAAAGEEAEAALIAERARAAAERYGADRVAIVFRHADRHVGRLRVALAGEGVPADLDVLVAAGRTPFGLAARRLLAAASGGDRGDLIAFLRSPFAGVEPAVVDGLDAGWRTRRENDRGKALSDAARSGPRQGRMLKLAKRLAVRPLDPATLRDWKEMADALLSAAHEGADLPGDPDIAVDAAAHRALLDVVCRLAELGDERLGMAEVLAAFDETLIPLAAAETPGHVQVTEAHRLRSRRFDAVIVGGMTAGDFSAEGRQGVADQLADRLVGATRPSEQALERMLFYGVCTRARRELVFTRQTADSDGAPKRPSVFWEEVLDLYRRPDPDSASSAEDALLADAIRLSDVCRAAPALSPRRAALRAQAASGGIGGCDSRVAGAISRARARRGVLSDPEVLGRLAERDEFSGTELELYARCPYRWFYERAVRPETLDVVLDERAHGSLAHRVLADFYAGLAAHLDTARVTPATLGRSLEFAGEVFDRVVASAGIPSAVTLAERDGISKVRRRVLRLVESDAEFLPGFAPARMEMRFGTPDQRRPDATTAGPVDLGGFRLRGSVDRIDEGHEGLVVIDYKSGEVPTGAALLAERHLQVGLYAAVAARLLDRPVVAGLYRSLKGGGARGFWVKDLVASAGIVSNDAVPDLASAGAIVEATVSLAREAADGIRAGEIPARPASPGACGYCPAVGFCDGGGAP